MSDGPMHRRMFVEMSPADQQAFVSNLQRKRLLVVEQYEQLQQAKAAAVDAKTRELIDKQSRVMQRDIDAMERAMERIDTRMVKIAGLRAMLQQGA